MLIQKCLPIPTCRKTPSGDALEDALFIGAHQCVGYAKRMDVPPDLFRAYISDAVYRWVVAARGVDSLIPDDDNG